MRRLMLSLAALVGTCATAQTGLAAEGLAVPIDQSAPISLPAGAMNVIVGNPAIADVNVLDPRSAVILGRSYGVTNLLVLDGRGRVLMDRPLIVSAADGGRVTMVRGSVNGPHLENFACSPRCERVPMPGESDTDFNRYIIGYVGNSGRANDGRSSGAAKPGP